jgi:hypothetical protein
VIFGESATFAIEAIAEPGPEFLPLVGSNVAGRIQLLIRGSAVGKFHEPCCVLGPIAHHLSAIGQSQSLWHPSLAKYSHVEQFSLLDAIFYSGSSTPKQQLQALADCIFLTNVSEAFDPVKAFVLRPPGDEFVFLVRRTPDDAVLQFRAPVATFNSAAFQFEHWLRSQEQHLTNQHA